jgi:transposase
MAFACSPQGSVSRGPGGQHLLRSYAVVEAPAVCACSSNRTRFFCGELPPP